MATPQTDPVSGAQFDIDSWHALIHAGRVWHSITPTANVAGVGTTFYLLRMDANVGHFRWHVDADKLCLLTLYENPVVTVEGTARAPLNRRRDSTRTTAVTAFSLSTLNVAAATVLDGHMIGDAGGGGGYGELVDQLEWDGAANEDYAIGVNNVAVNTRVSVSWTFYEELP